MGIVSFPRKRFKTGIRRRSSSASEVRSEPGRVDSAPMSRMSAPSSSSSMARAKARSGSRYFPPSENESGVTLSTPMTSVRSPAKSSRVFSFQTKWRLFITQGHDRIEIGGAISRIVAEEYAHRDRHTHAEHYPQQ